MTKRTYLLSTLIVLFLGIGINASAIDRQALAKYAASLKGKKGAELKTAIFQISQPTKVLTYGGKSSNSTWSGFVKTDRIGNTLECRNRYSTDRFYFTSTTQTSAISGMNIEHSFPKSWWGGDENKAYKDLYNLYPSESSANNKKSNYVMGKVTNPSILDDYEKVGNGTYGNFYVVEPHDNWKGDFCRSYFYMVTTYQNLSWTSQGVNCLDDNTWPTLKKWAYTLYLDWTRTDKVDDIEVDRNNAVYAIQGNRNLFIDYPYLAEYVWGDSVDVAFDPTTSISTASDDDRYLQGGTPDTPDTPDTPEPGDMYYFSATNNVTPGKKYLIVADNSGTLKAMKIWSGNKAYGYFPVDDVTELDDTIKLSSLDNAYTITADGSKYKIADSQNRYIWHDGSYKTISVSTDGSSKGSWTITPNGDGTFKIAFTDNYYVQYSTKYTSYGCYPDAQGIMPKLYMQVEKNATAIVNVNADTRRAYNGNIYTIQGRLVGKDASVLAPGLYIKDGKKFVVR